MRDVRLRGPLAGATLALALGSGASADVFADRRATCDHVLTVVRAACVVERVFMCPDGVEYDEYHEPTRLIRAELFSEEEASWSVVDGETGLTMMEASAAAGGFSLAELMEAGWSGDTYEGVITVPGEPPERFGVTLDVRLTDEEVALGGITFRVAESTIAMSLPDSGQSETAQTLSLIDVERRVMLDDARNGGIEDHPIDSRRLRILDVLLPGDPDFMETGSPVCGPSLEHAPQEEPSDD